MLGLFRQGKEPVSPALAGRFFSAEPTEKPQILFQSAGFLRRSHEGILCLSLRGVFLWNWGRAQSLQIGLSSESCWVMGSVMGEVFLRSRLKPNAVCAATSLDVWVSSTVKLLTWMCLPPCGLSLKCGFAGGLYANILVIRIRNQWEAFFSSFFLAS